MKTQEFKSLYDLQKAFPTEESCIQELAKSRWSEPVCIHCGSVRKIYTIKGGRLFKCADCRKTFSVRVGTIFEDSALPLQKWFMALWLISSHKKGISSLQLSRDIGVTQKTAWFMLHRIRYAMRTPQFNKPMNGIVEVDETYVGGKTHGQGRGVYGIYHHISKKHIDKYVDEFEFRFNTRKMKDSQRFSNALCHLNGRLMYKSLTSQ